jgi:phage terminase Nu1 subunit (DNA packaging protein)
MAKLVGYSVQNLVNLEIAGVVKRTGRDSWDPAVTSAAFFAHLKAERKANTAKAATGRVQDARTREIELRTKERGRELISMEEAMAYVDIVFGRVRTILSGVPARCTRDVPMRRKIEQEINLGLESVSRDARKAGQAVRSGQPLAEAFAEDDPDSVGEEEQDLPAVE